MPHLRVVKSKRIKDILTKNPYWYAKTMEPIYEVHRVLHSKMVELCCRCTHCIKARSTKVSENDNLYELFRKFTKNDICFIWQWLKVFVILNHHNLKLRARKYLASKGLAYDNWMTSITDGMKGDIFALYALCMLFDRHAIVHLRNGLVWSTLDKVSVDHYTDLKKCIKDWNLHHRLKIKTLIECSICNRKFTMPSAHHAHKYTHTPARHRCGQCQCVFIFDSWLEQHKQVHVRSKLQKCFSGSCKESYKWPQDLEKHIQKHMNRKWTCPDCSKTFKEERLLKRH